jgi:hypothetical protein
METSIDEMLEKLDPGQKDREASYNTVLEDEDIPPVARPLIKSIQQLDELVQKLILEFIQLVHATSERLKTSQSTTFMVSALLRALTKKGICSESDLAAELQEIHKDIMTKKEPTE